MPASKDTKEIGLARVAFESRFKAFADYQSPEPEPLSRERDAIQLFALSLVRILFLLGENKQGPMLLQYVQTAMGDTVTPQGLKRPVILGQGQELLAALPEKPERAVLLRLVQEEGSRLAELQLPVGDEGHFYPATAIFFFQYLIKTLSDPSLFFLVLVLGGLMEYYEKIGKTNDLSALTGAPAHAFSTAIRYIDEERRRHQPLSDPSTN